ncbi:MAG TPA: MBL fold metallo-hydrolase [Solirubrobacterales bacterium]|nr:MBL fold metallo-hydrolase [Solirubrobacterales bacterium]
MSADQITYVGHATVLVELGGARLLTDPVLRERVGPLRRHGAPPPPDLAHGLDAVLISHLHHDHADLPSLRQIERDAPVLAAPGGGELLTRHGFRAVTELAPGESTRIGRVTVTATEALHPSGGRFERDSEAVGFLLRAGGRRVYFAGDTDLFDSMEEIGGDALDLALLPVWGWGPSLGPGHLDPERAARAAALLSPRIAVPIHWGTLYPLGLARLRRGPLRTPPREFAARVRELAPQVEVRVLAPGEATSLA